MIRRSGRRGNKAGAGAELEEVEEAEEEGR